MAIIAPSLLAADFLNLGKDCEMVNQSQADWFHIDIMDGNFVPNISLGLPIINAIRQVASKPLDVHLMIEQPERYAEAFKKSGADRLTVHYEACNHLHRNLTQIRNLGMKAGVALNPHTPVEGLKYILEYADQVCIMSVNPGFGGQEFIPETLRKIKDLRKMISEAGSATLIEVDGGVTDKNAQQLLDAGVDILVAGSCIFKSTDPKQMILTLKNLS